MSRKRTPVRSTGPVKGTKASPMKNVKPAWSKMLDPEQQMPDPMTKSSFTYDNGYSDSEEEDEGDGLYNNSSRQLPNERPRSGFSLKNTMNSLNIDTGQQQSKKSVDNFFQNSRQQNMGQRSMQNPPHKVNMLTSSTNPSRPRKKRHQQMGPFEPNIPPELEKHIVSGEYVEFAEIVMLLGHQKTQEEAFTLLAKDILVWLDCYMFYTAIVGSVAPGRISGLMRYSRIILWIYKESQDASSWWRYDKAFRRFAATKSKNENGKILFLLFTSLQVCYDLI